ncbi:5'-nucleotidase, lipoprotein e(P4) family [Pedobacter sp. HMF7647]|uniref:5'-nucleotidase, lipoprotein e(P4) family n=1 Tax=Hufsiella arboris TaxID=2695275 RepID=A0A7K1YEK6_9SPHI|nr:5'-nucleotidase, lipoprotein e(P4) family [Hufsiella arboris]MXV53025.1 5'-nucleotidase, lipoprotein e(P4) family [Hufsiella arboris]
MLKRLLCVALVFTISKSYAQTENYPSYSHDNVNAVLWQQYSGEYRALCFQGYNFAKLSLDQALKTKSAKKRCIVVDIDETVLDNSPAEGKQLQKGGVFNYNDWKAWTDLAKADTVPGALSFLKYAAKKGVETFYISNRGLDESATTLKNLVDWGFPFADQKHLMLKDKTSNKEARRQEVLKNYNIVMLCGDNLGDFAEVFYQRNQTDRNTAVDSLRNEFGRKFIMLPNPMYGDWESAIFDNKKGLTEQEKSEIKSTKLKSF